METIQTLSCKLLRKNPDKVYLFGDNLLRKGKGGQTIIRDEPNAIGVPTKKKPSMSGDSFFTDDEFELNKRAIDQALGSIPTGKIVVLPESGLGTGRAQL